MMTELTFALKTGHSVHFEIVFFNSLVLTINCPRHQGKLDSNIFLLISTDKSMFCLHDVHVVPHNLLFIIYVYLF